MCFGHGFKCCGLVLDCLSLRGRFVLFGYFVRRVVWVVFVVCCYGFLAELVVFVVVVVFLHLHYFLVEHLRCDMLKIFHPNKRNAQSDVRSNS